MTETQLTGAQVREMRESYGVSRREFAERCGFPTQTRLFNIEQHDSWKPGDADAVRTVLAQLASDPPRGKRGRRKGETGEQRAARLMQTLQEKGKAINPRDVPDEIVTFTPALEDEDPSSVDWASFGSDQSTSSGPNDIVIVDSDVSDLDTSSFDGDNVEFTDPYDSWVRAQEGDRPLTNSEVAVWERCRRKWWFGYYRALIPKRVEILGARATGGRVHRALAAWYVPDGVEPTDPRVALERVIEEDWAALADYLRREGTQGDVEEQLATMYAEFQQACDLERAMIEGYVQWVQETGEDAKLKITAPEQAISAVIEGDVAGEHVKVELLAKLDARARRLTDGVRVFIDHKTTDSLTKMRPTLHMDSQMLHYLLMEFLNSSEGDERCDAALYNMLRKVKRSDRAHPPFYERVEVHHSEIELESYKRRLLGVARDVQRATRELDEGHDPLSIVYPTPRLECRFDCSFFGVCPMADDGSRLEDALQAHFDVGDPLARYKDAN